MKIIGLAILVCSLVSYGFAIEDVVTATHGTITKIDKATKTFAVKTADGAEHIFYWAKDTSVHGMKATDVAAADSWHGLKEGSEVVAHSTKRGAKDTAVEVDILALSLNDELRSMVGTLRNPSGVVVVARVANFMSSETGLETGDIIHSVNQAPVDSLSSLRAALTEIKPHDPVVLQVERGGGLQWLAFDME